MKKKRSINLCCRHMIKNFQREGYHIVKQNICFLNWLTRNNVVYSTVIFFSWQCDQNVGYYTRPVFSTPSTKFSVGFPFFLEETRVGKTFYEAITSATWPNDLLPGSFHFRQISFLRVTHTSRSTAKLLFPNKQRILSTEWRRIE